MSLIDLRAARYCRTLHAVERAQFLGDMVEVWRLLNMLDPIAVKQTAAELEERGRRTMSVLTDGTASACSDGRDGPQPFDWAASPPAEHLRQDFAPPRVDEVVTPQSLDAWRVPCE